MSDDIAKIDGQNAIAYTGARPWHHKGTRIPSLMTVEEALIAGRLDWEVEKAPIMVADPSMTIIPNTFATGRRGPEVDTDGNKLFIPFEGTVKGRYTIVQNAEAFDFFNSAIEDKVACIETVGALGKGETIWAMARLPETFEVSKDDPIEQYILLTNSHDGSGSIMAVMTPVRVVCCNTLTAAIRGANNIVKIRHTKSAHSKIESLHLLLNASDNYWSKLKDAYAALALKDMSRLDTMEFISKMFPGKMTKVKQINGPDKFIEVVSTRTQNNRDKVMNLFEGQAKGSDKAGKNAWGMFNAFTEYLDSHRSIRKDTNSWEASNFGSGTNVRQQAFNMLTSMV